MEEVTNLVNLRDQLKRDEGFRSRPYRDTSGKWTIGYGRNLSDVGISPDEANRLLTEDIKLIREQVLDRWPSVYSLSTPRQNAIYNMGFNMGVGGLSQFVKMWEAIEQEDFDRAADEMLNSKWAKQVNGRAERLANTMRTGK